MRFPFLAVLTSLAALLPACAKRETPAEGGIRTKTLLIGNQNEPASLDPHVVDALTDQIILTSLLEGLAVIDEKTSQALPGVAERWDVSPPKFHDNRRCTKIPSPVPMQRTSET